MNTDTDIGSRAESMAEIVIAEYILRKVNESLAAAMFCGCRHCRVAARHWVEWWAGEDEDLISAVLAEVGLE